MMTTKMNNLELKYTENYKSLVNYFEVVEWMRHNYVIFNSLYFDNLLPPDNMMIFEPIIKSVNYLGKAYNCNSGFVSVKDPMKIRLNFNYDIVELEWKNVLLHEMIHIWEYTLGYKGGHGKLFKRKMNEINKYGWGITCCYKNILEEVKTWR